MNEKKGAAGSAALIAMSGGVDSSVAAKLTLDRGYSCTGCTMRLYENDMIGMDLLDTCCSLKDTRDARAVCDKLGIPYFIFHYENEFTEKVIEPFVASYERGETPNPCINCNRHLKFHSLYQRAKEMGCGYIVTGHYARITEEKGHFYLRKAVDPDKDQSYVLYDLKEEQLAHTLFPLGDHRKEETRAIASEMGFVNAKKKESQDICFVPDGDYGAMICRFRGKEYPEGPFLDMEGNQLGIHKGIIHYTIGQRRGLGIPADRRLYVVKLDICRNAVILGDDKDLYRRGLVIRNFHWITGEIPSGEMRCTAKIRYQKKEAPAVLQLPEKEGGTARLLFDEPQRAITPGQSAVCYDGDIVLGGGIIQQTEEDRDFVQ
ncbi:MAG: tRNA 2-thiouridine(34) synthase MnmA [Eubacterium sp.]|nr:tRNA 2-thiouridine(34) synthase MnmA [Eubacterium sp.]